MKALLTLLLAVIHAVAGLAILLVSAWFIAACAVAPISFNYMLPAVVIRALALLRIGSGYAHMWLGHHHLLGLTTRLRLRLFARLQTNRLEQRSEEIEALATHTEAIAAVWIGWVSQQASAIAMLLLAGLGFMYVGVPLSVWSLALILAWPVLMLGLCVYGLALAKQQVAQELGFRCASDAQLSSVAIWHLRSREQQWQQLPSARSVWHSELKQQGAMHGAGWLLQGVAWLTLTATIIGASQSQGEVVFGDPLLLVIPMMLLSAGDWLGRSFTGQTALNRYSTARQAIKALPLSTLQTLPAERPAKSVQLLQFGALHLPLQQIDYTFAAQGLYLLSGASGSGKSQLLKAMSGLVESHGERRVDNRSLPQGLVASWMYAEQEAVILAASVGHNLTLGKDYSDAQLRAVLQQVQLSSLTNLKEWCGPGGRQLSGGERKRLAVARLLLSDAPIWLLDEPFEGLDKETIALLCELLARQASRRLIVVASHIGITTVPLSGVIRLSTD